MTDALLKHYQYRLELRARGPISFEDAEFVGAAFCQAAGVAMLASSPIEIGEALGELKAWGGHLEARRRIIEGEVKRLERTPIDVRIVLNSSGSLEDDRRELSVRVAECLASIGGPGKCAL